MYFGTTQKNMETTNWFLVGNEGMYHIIWRLYRLYRDYFPLYSLLRTSEARYAYYEKLVSCTVITVGDFRILPGYNLGFSLSTPSGDSATPSACVRSSVLRLQISMYCFIGATEQFRLRGNAPGVMHVTYRRP